MAVAVLAALAGTHIVRSPPSKKVLVPVDVVRPAALPAPAPPPAPPPIHAAPAPQPGGSTASAAAHARREPVHHAEPVAPASMRSLADLTISYDDAASFAAPGPTKTGAAGGSGRTGIGAGASTWRGDGVANITIPQPAATVSRARSPRPKRDYSNLRIPGASKFAGETVKLQLTIGVNGRVHGVQLLQGVNRELDRKTIALAQTFEYEPALDDEGFAIQGTSRWDIQIVEDQDGDLFETAREHRHR